jgi:hypothetical protein
MMLQQTHANKNVHVSSTNENVCPLISPSLRGPLYISESWMQPQSRNAYLPRYHFFVAVLNDNHLARRHLCSLVLRPEHFRQHYIFFFCYYYYFLVFGGLYVDA